MVYPLEDTDSEFKRAYAPDVYGDEASENARLWRIYRDEASTHDKTLLDGWHKTLDILLIFVSWLFAAEVDLIDPGGLVLRRADQSCHRKLQAAPAGLHGVHGHSPVHYRISERVNAPARIEAQLTRCIHA